MSLLRVYEPEELGRDGYPFAWYRDPRCAGTGWICDHSGAPKTECPDPTCTCEAMSGCPECYAPGGTGGEGSIKGLVRALADHRCVRCGHPYRKGEHGSGEWSPCDERCTHGAPYRLRHIGGEEWGLGDSLAKGGEPIFARIGLRPDRYEIEAQWRILTVHHLTGIKPDCRWWNLAALCQRCHLQIQGRVQMGQVYPFEHTDWFKPYAAGYYAASYLGEDLTREETLERLDELLALEAVA